MAAIRQASFGGGEIDPVLHGRSDVQAYGTALATCRNFFVSKHGAAVSRPGTTYIATAFDGSAAVRLIPFLYADGESYVLEFGDGYIRFLRDGELVTVDGTPYGEGGVPYKIAAPYAAADLARLKYAQVGDVMTLTHPDYMPRELVRSGDADWSLTTIDFAVPEYDGQTPFAVDRSDAPDGSPPVGEDGNPLTKPDQSVLPALKWRYKVTVVRRRRDGVTYETAPVDVTALTDGDTNPPQSSGEAFPDLLPIGEQWPLELRFGNDGLQTADDDQIISTEVYRGRDGSFGWVGRAKGGQDTSEGGTFRDEGQDPDFTRQPPAGTNPFEVKDGQDTVLRTEEPTAVAYFDNRQVFGGTTERPNYLWASKENDYLNFDEPFPLVANNARQVHLAARKREELRSLLGLDRLLVFTDASVWAASGAGGGPLSAIELPEARVQQEVGASWLDPLVVGGTVLFARAKGTGVRDLAYSNDRRGFAGGDVSFLAQHLFARELVSWAYAEDPWGVVWAALADGSMVSLTYAPEQQVLAWARHDTDGEVESICAVPESTEDAVYLVVKRTIDGSDVRYIERMASRLITDASLAICLDCAKSQFYPYDPAAPWDGVVSGLDHLEGESVTALVNGDVMGPFTVSGGSIDLGIAQTSAIRATVGLPYTCDLGLLEVAGARTQQKRVHAVEWELHQSRGFFTGPDFDHLTEWRQRQVSDSYDAIALYTGRAHVRIRSGYDREGAVVLRQIDPLPVTVLGVTREIDVGG